MQRVREAVSLFVTAKPDRILIRGVNWIGDAVLTIPAIKSVRKAYPDAHISLLAKPWTAEIFKASRDIDEIILYENKFSSLIGKFRLARLLRERNFDMAILLQNAFDAAFIAWLARIPVRAGYRRDCRRFLLTTAIPITEDLLKKHQVHYYLNIVNSIGIKTADTLPCMQLDDRERDWAGKHIKSSFPGNSFPVVGINPGATYGSAKRWPPERFADLICRITYELEGRVLIFGGEAEVGIANEIIAEINKLKIKRKIEKKGSRILVMSGKTSLRELAALIAECDAFVTNDSGPMHMAAALLVPTAAIFGSTNIDATGPFGEGHKVVSKTLPCSPCMKRKCPEKHLDCMTQITADEVFDAVREILPVNKAVLLDKDGTLIEDKNYLNSFDDLVILRGTKRALKTLKEAGFMLIGITNQSGVARGIVDEKFVRESNEYLRNELGIDDFYYCPHHPDEGCSCRKPQPQMALKARLRHRINLRKSYVIGDKESDVLVAGKTGAVGILLSSTPLFEKSDASYIAKDLKDAASWILAREKNVRGCKGSALDKRQ